MELFLNPALLLGGLLAAVPIVLHLIMRQKPRPVTFAALQFLKVRQQATTRKLQLQHILLLLLRIALVCLMALALSRPRLPAGTGLLPDPNAPVAAVFVFDTSPAMGYLQNQKTRLDDARALAGQLLSQFPRESQVAVLDSQLGSALFQVDIPAAVARIQPERLKLSTAPQPLARQIEQAFDLLSKTDPSRRLRKEIYVFTDLGRRVWQEAAFARVREASAKQPEIGTYVIDVGVPEPQNFALGDIRPSRQVVPKNLPLTIRGELRRTGPAAARTVELLLTGPDGQSTKRGEVQLDLPAGDGRTFELPLTGLDIGLHQGELTLLGGDGLPIDDKRYFTVRVQPPVKILLAGASPEAVLVVDQALAPERMRQRGQARFETEYASFADLALPDRIASYPLVWLIDPPPLPATVWRNLHDFARRGGSVGFFLGPAARADTASFNTPEPQLLLAGKIALEARRPQGDLFLAPDPAAHPMLERFAPLAGKIPWDLLAVQRYWLLEELAPDAQTVIPYTNGKPALLERPVGQGRAVTFTTPIAERPDAPAPWNLLPRQPLWPYMMLVDQLAQHLGGASSERLNHTVGQTALIRLPPAFPRSNLVVTFPTQEKRARTTDPQQNTFTVPQTSVPGHYRVEGGPNREVDAGFSANLPAVDSDLTRVAPEALPAVLGQMPYRLARELQKIRSEQDLGREGRPLFPYLMVLLAAVLASEGFVANRFRRGSADAAS